MRLADNYEGTGAPMKLSRGDAHSVSVAWKAFNMLRRIYSETYGLNGKDGTAREFIAEAYKKMGYHLEAFSVSSAEDVLQYLSRLICTVDEAEKQFDILQSISEFYYSVVEKEKYAQRALATEKEITAKFSEIRKRIETGIPNNARVNATVEE